MRILAVCILLLFSMIGSNPFASVSNARAQPGISQAAAPAGFSGLTVGAILENPAGPYLHLDRVMEVSHKRCNVYCEPQPHALPSSFRFGLVGVIPEEGVLPPSHVAPASGQTVFRPPILASA